MSNYHVTIIVNAEFTISVNADDKDEAEMIAIDAISDDLTLQGTWEYDLSYTCGKPIAEAKD